VPSLARGLTLDPRRRQHEEWASGSGLRQLREIGQRQLVRPVQVFNDEQSRLQAARPVSKPEERALLTLDAHRVVHRVIGSALFRRLRKIEEIVQEHRILAVHEAHA